MDSIYCHINGTDHQNDPAVRNGSFIRMRHIIIPQINLLGFGFMPKRVILYRKCQKNLNNPQVNMKNQTKYWQK